MESQPQNPEFRNNPENFHPWKYSISDSMVNVQKYQTLFLFSNKMLVIRTGIHKMLVRTANREDP